MIFFDLERSQAGTNQGHSVSNEVQVRAGVWLCKEILSAEKLKETISAEPIAVLAPYDAQCRLYLRVLAESDAKEPALNLRKTIVRKIDGFQGGSGRSSSLT